MKTFKTHLTSIFIRKKIDKVLFNSSINTLPIQFPLPGGYQYPGLGTKFGKFGKLVKRTNNTATQTKNINFWWFERHLCVRSDDLNAISVSGRELFTLPKIIAKQIFTLPLQYNSRYFQLRSHIKSKIIKSEHYIT